MIPKVIYQSWKTLELPNGIRENVEHIKKMNPEYDYFLYDDEMCREFLLQHFGKSFVQAFDSILYGAFKCDFWRYAVLYVNGGVYMDIDIGLLTPLKNIINNSSFISVLEDDNKKILFSPKLRVYQAFFACTPKHPIVYTALMMSYYNLLGKQSEIFENLSITGPVVMANAVNLYLGNDSFEKIKTGTMFTTDGEYIYNTKGHEIMRNKIEGYEPVHDYRLRLQIYKNDPRYRYKQNLFKIVVGILIVLLICFLLFLYYRRKYIICSSSKSSSLSHYKVK